MCHGNQISGQGAWTGPAAENIAHAAQGQFGAPGGGAVAVGTGSTSAVGKLADTLTSAMPAAALAQAASAVPATIGQAAHEVVSAVPTQIVVEQTQRVCPACKQPAANKKFCTNCGALLGPVTIMDTPNKQIELERTASIVVRERLDAIPAGQASSSVVAPPFPFATSAPVSQPMQNIVEEFAPEPAQERKTINQVLRQSYTQSADIGQTNPAPKRTITSLNPDLPRPVPKLE